MNKEIRFSPLRVIDADGTQLGVLSKEEAFSRAEEYGLDLVEVSPNARPPVVKIMDFGKFKYEQAKAEKKHNQKQKTGELKEIRFGLKIGTHDLDIKLRRAEEFFKDNNKVQIILRFKGREITHKELGFELLKKFIDRLNEISKLEGGIKSQGMSITALLVPK
ncbi:translation initiation factor IF-3 [bacterium CG2_30_33_46]|nr:MAG: translation initiation factor IF-3 [bacterium CG2_30_33_46]